MNSSDGVRGTTPAADLAGAVELLLSRLPSTEDPALGAAIATVRHYTRIAGAQAAAPQPLAVLERGEGGAFRVKANMGALRAIYAMPAGEHKLYASGVDASTGAKP